MGNLNKNQKTLISIHVIRMILELFTSTFLTSHILSFSADNVLGTGLLNVGLFFVAEFTVYAVLYYIVCFYVDKSNRIGFLRIGIFVNLCLLVLLVFFGEQLASWVILAGVIVGISDAFYYPSYLVMKNEFTSRKTVNDYNIFKHDEIVYYITDANNNLLTQEIKIKPKEYLIGILENELISTKKKWYV